MTDIVEYLRRNAVFNYKDTYIAAADEIERLREMLHVQFKMVLHYVEERDDARRELDEIRRERHGKKRSNCLKEKP